MKVAALKKPGGLENIVIEERPDPKPGKGEVLMRVHASSLNYHDFIVAIGGMPADDGRILMSDGAGEVVDVGEGVTRFKKGDKVLSTFFPNWRDGRPALDKLLGVPGDHADGFAAELVACSEQRSCLLDPQGHLMVCAGVIFWQLKFSGDTERFA